MMHLLNELTELASRGTWLKIQQDLVEFGFDTKLQQAGLQASHGEFSCTVTHRCMSSTHERRTFMINVDNSHAHWAKADNPNKVLSVVTELFLDSVLKVDIDWLDEQEQEQHQELAKLIIAGRKIETIEVVGGMEQEMIKFYEKKGWTLFANSDGPIDDHTQESLLIFYR